MVTPSHFGRSRWRSQSRLDSSPTDSTISSSFRATSSSFPASFISSSSSVDGKLTLCDMPVGSLMWAESPGHGIRFTPCLVSSVRCQSRNAAYAASIDFHQFSWKAFWACIPTQMALVFFGILHVPLNVSRFTHCQGKDLTPLDAGSCPRRILAGGQR